MELAQELVRRLARSFFDIEHAVVVDALVAHSALSIDDFKIIFANTGRGSKEIAKYLGRLRENGLVSMYGRQETKPNAQKATTVEYWFIDYRYAVDATNYKLYRMEQALTKQGKPTTEKKEFSCPTCKSEWATLDVIGYRDDLQRGSGFLCPNCRSVLDYHPHGRGERAEEDNVLSRFNNEMETIIQLLRHIGQTIIPEVTGEMALERARPIPRPVEGGLRALPSISEPSRVRPAAVMGLKTGPEKVEITLTTDSENTAAAQQAEAERRARIAAQNQLPDWHTHSTVSGQAIDSVKRDADGTETNGVGQDGDTGEEGQNIMSTEDLDEIYKQLEVERERERLRLAAAEGGSDEYEEEDEDDDDSDDIDLDKIAAGEDEEEEFVDIDVTGTSTEKPKAVDPETRADESGTSTPVVIPDADPAESDEDDDFEDV